MSEETLYIGDDTAAAAILRNRRISDGLQSTPGRWFATVLGAVLGKRVDHTPAAMQQNRAFARGVLAGLGYDPDSHELTRRRGANPGFVVRDGRGRPVEYVSTDRLEKLESDINFMESFSAEAGSD